MEISKVYAENHLNMVEMSEPGKTCDPTWDDFQEGIVNGAYWYIIKGGMQVNFNVIVLRYIQAYNRFFPCMEATPNRNFPCSWIMMLLRQLSYVIKI